MFKERPYFSRSDVQSPGTQVRPQFRDHLVDVRAGIDSLKPDDEPFSRFGSAQGRKCRHVRIGVDKMILRRRRHRGIENDPVHRNLKVPVVLPDQGDRSGLKRGNSEPVAFNQNGTGSGFLFAGFGDHLGEFHVFEVGYAEQPEGNPAVGIHFDSEHLQVAVFRGFDILEPLHGLKDRRVRILQGEYGMGGRGAEIIFLQIPAQDSP